jgi:hypothetical protein
MSALEFIAEIAWPVTILVIVLIFRRSILDMLSGQLLTRLKAGPVEANWERGVSEIRAELAHAPEPAAGRPSTGSLLADLGSLAERDPPTAVFEASARVEEELRRVVASAGDPHIDVSRLGISALAQEAHRAGRLNAETAQALDGLSVLRNLVAHGRAGDVTRDRAMEYLALADGALYSIRREQSEG